MIANRLIYTFSAILLALTAACCGSRDNASRAATDAPKAAPAFDADSAMAFLAMQVEAGPRVPGTAAHDAMATRLAGELSRLGADTVITQRVTATAWNGDKLPLHNILGRFNTGAPGRPILLVAHWDTRPWADSDPNPSNHSRPIDGANDGGSGTAVLLEIARQAGLHSTNVPLDILLVDGEDYGDHGDNAAEDTWCLGTQQWVKEMPYTASTQPSMGILLDMVGGRNARFHREYLSDAMARSVVDRVWARAQSLGLQHRFIDAPGGAVVDDHLYLNRAGIPTIDIIENRNPETGSFPPTWHTMQDNIENIDPSTLRDVGTLISSLTIKQ